MTFCCRPRDAADNLRIIPDAQMLRGAVSSNGVLYGGPRSRRMPIVPAPQTLLRQGCSNNTLAARTTVHKHLVGMFSEDAFNCSNAKLLHTVGQQGDDIGVVRELVLL